MKCAKTSSSPPEIGTGGTYSATKWKTDRQIPILSTLFIHPTSEETDDMPHHVPVPTCMHTSQIMAMEHNATACHFRSITSYVMSQQPLAIMDT